MEIFGITGSIGVGKSTVADFFKRDGHPVFDADDTVRQLYRRPSVIDKINNEFPTVVEGGQINKSKLANHIFGNHIAFNRLEAILHPLVRRKEIGFIKRCYYDRAAVCALDIPLLFETGAQDLMDWVITVWVPDHIQRQRVLNRRHMNEERLQFIRQRQLPQAVKKQAADFTICSGLGKRMAYHQYQSILSKTVFREGINA